MGRRGWWEAVGLERGEAGGEGGDAMGGRLSRGWRLMVEG